MEWRDGGYSCHDGGDSGGHDACHGSPTRAEGAMLNNRFAREALKQAATQVNQGVREGARQFIERETIDLRQRIDELEGRVARLERQVAELLREQERLRP
jgi:hypothetical protein